MTALNGPWLTFSMLIPFGGALYAALVQDRQHNRKVCIGLSAATLSATLAAWINLLWMGSNSAADPWDPGLLWFKRPLWQIDLLTAPLMSIAVLLDAATAFLTLRTKLPRYSFARSLFSLGLWLAMFAAAEPWGVVLLLIAGTVPPLLELRARQESIVLYAVHMGAFALALVTGQWLLDSSARNEPSTLGILCLLFAVWIRNGCVPFHLWMVELFAQATFGTALLFATRMAGAYAAVRLLLPTAPVWALKAMGLLAAVTALYAAGMLFVQHDSRRFFAYLFISQSALILVGLQIATPLSLTGALSLWLSDILALGGFGLVLRSVEARTGRLDLTNYHGWYDQLPMLGALFLVTGLASVGFPGTFGFAGAELLVESAVETNVFFGLAVVFAAALTGIAVVQAYFRIFTGKPSTTPLELRGRWVETVTVVTLTLLILGGGMWPQPGIQIRYHAALMLLDSRTQRQTSASHELKAPSPPEWPTPLVSPLESFFPKSGGTHTQSTVQGNYRMEQKNG